MLPLLYLNLGGEMMYIIDQRLIAQQISADKASKGKIYYITASWPAVIYFNKCLGAAQFKYWLKSPFFTCFHKVLMQK